MLKTPMENAPVAEFIVNQNVEFIGVCLSLFKEAVLGMSHEIFLGIQRIYPYTFNSGGFCTNPRW